MKDRNACIAGYRHAADLMEAHPGIPSPIVAESGTIHWHLYSWSCPDGVPQMVAAIRRAVGGRWDKREARGYDDEMVFEREGYSITCKREAVCTRRVVGTETVTKPAISLPERTETVEIVEWDCDPILERAS